MLIVVGCGCTKAAGACPAAGLSIGRRLNWYAQQEGVAHVAL